MPGTIETDCLPRPLTLPLKYDLRLTHGEKGATLGLHEFTETGGE